MARSELERAGEKGGENYTHQNEREKSSAEVEKSESEFKKE